MTVQKTSKKKIFKSSQDCRDLIKAALQSGKNDRRAAELLKYTGSIAALNKMYRGLLHDTPEMKRIITRRKRRARVAFLNFKEQADDTRHEQILSTRIALNQIAKVADDLLIRIDKEK